MGGCGVTSRILHRWCLTSFAVVRRIVVCAGADVGRWVIYSQEFANVIAREFDAVCEQAWYTSCVR